MIMFSSDNVFVPTWYMYLSRLPWIFPGAPLNFNGAPGNIQGNLTGMFIAISIIMGPTWRSLWLSKSACKHRCVKYLSSVTIFRAVVSFWNLAQSTTVLLYSPIFIIVIQNAILYHSRQCYVSIWLYIDEKYVILVVGDWHSVLNP